MHRMLPYILIGCLVIVALGVMGCEKKVIHPSRYLDETAQQTTGTAQSAPPSPAGATPYGQTSTPIVSEELLSGEDPLARPSTSAPGAAPAASSIPPSSPPPAAAPAASGFATAPGESIPPFAPPASTPGTAQPLSPNTAYAPPASTVAPAPTAPAAADELAALRTVEEAAPAPSAISSPAPASLAPPANGSAPPAVYQLQSFLDPARALAYRESLAARSYDVFFEETKVDGRPYTRVLVRLPGDALAQQAALQQLGASDARRRRDMEAGSSGMGARPSAQSPSPAAASAIPMPPPALPIPGDAAVLPIVSPPAESPGDMSSAENPEAPLASGAPAAGPQNDGCRITPLHIEARGTGLPGFGSPIMVEQQAREDARRNLLFCIDSYRKEQGLVPASYTMPATVPPGLLQVGDVELNADGSVSATMRMRLTDLPKLDVQVLQ